MLCSACTKDVDWNRPTSNAGFLGAAGNLPTDISERDLEEEVDTYAQRSPVQAFCSRGARERKT